MPEFRSSVLPRLPVDVVVDMATTLWRWLDTGIRPAVENIALNRALLEAQQKGDSPCTVRVLGFEPVVLLGFHQSAEQELNLNYCAEHGIGVQRRITGGGAIYMDENQLGWELYASKQAMGTAQMSEIAAKLCRAVADGLQALGVNAVFRPRNDIEVEGRKISGTGGAFDGDALMYQGTLLMRLNVETMLGALRIPAEKLADKAVASARERVTSLETVLGKVPERTEIVMALRTALANALNAEFVDQGLTEHEQANFSAAVQEMAQPEWVNMVQTPVADRPVLHAAKRHAAGTLRVNVAFDAPQQRIRQVWFSGDVFVSPRRTLIDLESQLRDVLLERMDEVVQAFFAARNVDMLGLTAQDISELLAQACAVQEVV